MVDAGGGIRSFFGGFLQLGLALAIIIIVAVHLQWEWIYLANPLPPYIPGYYYFNCLLGNEYWERVLCNYAYAVAAIGIVCSIAICVLAVKSLHSMADAGVAGFATVWWIIAGIVFTVQSHYADDRDWFLSSGLPRNNWRHSIYAMCWAAAGCNLITLILSFVMRPKHKEREFHDVQPPLQPVAVVYQQEVPPPQQQGVPGYYPPPQPGQYVEYPSVVK